MPIFIARPSQRGASSLEHIVLILVFLLFAFAAYESTYWLLLRQALNHALLDTARVAATQHAHPTIINEAFIKALQQRASFDLNPDSNRWHIEKHSLPTLTPHSVTSVHFDYQALQYQQGHTQVFDANTLHLRLHYLHQPAIPLIRQAIAFLLGQLSGPYQRAYGHGYVPIVTEVQVAMQSDHRAVSTTPPQHYFSHLSLPADTSSHVPGSGGGSAPTGPGSDADTAPQTGTEPSPDSNANPTSPLPPWTPPGTSPTQPGTPPTSSTQPWQPPNSTGQPVQPPDTNQPPPTGCTADLCCGPS